jgi:hypothetical protein
MAAWHISGEYMETCDGEFLCPCITAKLAAQPTEGDCKAEVSMHIDKGQHDGVLLEGGVVFRDDAFPGCDGGWQRDRRIDHR